jgi:ketosteroid isomerase-like protein
MRHLNGCIEMLRRSTMAHGGGYGAVGPAAGLTAAAIDNVRLSYLYLDTGDIDGYSSLFHPDAVLRHPGSRPVRGHAQLEIAARQPPHGAGAHTIQRLFAAGDHVAAIGQFVGREPNRPFNVEFADIFAVSEHGLLTTRATYYFTSPQ